MSLRGHYQNAYVTHDLDAAMALLGRQYGVGNYIVFEPDMILKTPSGDKPAKVRAALAWCGGLQIELIEPVSGFVDPYLPYLPADKSNPTPRLHHIAVRRDDLIAMREEIGRSGLPLAFEGSVPGLIFVYLDARESLGHYFEYVWAEPAMWDATGWPKDRPVG
jgi:hypothetical protein